MGWGRGFGAPGYPRLWIPGGRGCLRMPGKGPSGWARGFVPFLIETHHGPVSQTTPARSPHPSRGRLEHVASAMKGLGLVTYWPLPSCVGPR